MWYEFKKCVVFGALVLSSVPSLGADLVVDDDAKEAPLVCEEIPLRRELKVFKDPSLFLPAVALLFVDPAMGWKRLREEPPLLSTFAGSIELMRIGRPTEFKSFISIPAVARMYEREEPKLVSPTAQKKNAPSPKIVRVKFCGGPNDAYSDTLGFVLESDLKLAQVEERRASVLAPSVFPNPIPQLP